MTGPNPQHEADEREADSLDGITLAADATLWHVVQRLQRRGLVRVEVHSRNSATVWRKREATPDA